MFKKIFFIPLIIISVLFIDKAQAATVSLTEDFSNYSLVQLSEITKNKEQRFKQAGGKGFYDSELTKYKILTKYSEESQTTSTPSLKMISEWSKFTDTLVAKARRTFGRRELKVRDAGKDTWMLIRFTINKSMEDSLNPGDPVYLYVRYIGTNSSGSYYYIEGYEKYSTAKAEVDENMQRYEQGLQYLKEGEYSRADKEFESLSDSVFTSSRASKYLVYISSAKKYLSQGDYMKAEDFVKKAIEANPVSPDMKYIIDAYVTRVAILNQKNYVNFNDRLMQVLENQTKLLQKIERLEKDNQELKQRISGVRTVAPVK